MGALGAETTATFRSKALFLCVRSLRGRNGASDFVRAVGAGRIFEDETKPISRELWLRALIEFEKMAGDEGFRRLPKYLVHPKNLGAWSSLLRGAVSPGDVFTKLDESGSEVDPGWTWRQRDQGSTTWSGEICFLESDTPDDRRRIRKALSAELRSIPLLFGLAPAKVNNRREPPREGAQDQGEQILQMASWQPATRKTLQAGVVASVLAGITAAAVVSLVGWSGWPRALIGLCGAFVCAGATLVLSRDVHHRTASRAQHIRILALEREAVLQKQQVKEISRPHEEPVIAGKYRLSDQLGVGAAGAVWRAKRLTDGALVAIKLLRTALAQDPRATDRLRREAQALGLSWHPHVVEVLDDGLLPSGVAFLVTELLNGETLGQRIRKKGPMSRSDTVVWALQAAEALVAIHSAGVIHRDVKPGNLFLHEPSPGAERLKLIDFGVASVSWAETRLTRHGARVGTPGYAAPEQETGDEVDARADLFALGQSMKEALTGNAPAPDEYLGAIMPPNLPAAWVSVLEKLTATAREDRYGSSKEARQALAELHELETGKAPDAAIGRAIRESIPPASA